MAGSTWSRSLEKMFWDDEMETGSRKNYLIFLYSDLGNPTYPV